MLKTETGLGFSCFNEIGRYPVAAEDYVLLPFSFDRRR
jgi:hypothetical protein